MEKEKRRISKMMTTVIIIGILLVIYGILWGIYHVLTKPSSNVDIEIGRHSTTAVYSNTNALIPNKSDMEYSLYAADAILDEQFSYNGPTFNLENIFVKSKVELENQLKTYIGTDKVKTDDGEVLVLSEKYNDEFFASNNLAIVMIPNVMHNVEVKSVRKNRLTVIINIKDEQYVTSTAILTEPSFIFVTLDKSVETVNFNIYKTTSYEKNENYKTTFIFAGVAITIIVIIIACLSISAHNEKLEANTNEEKPKKTVKKRIIKIIAIIVLVFIILISIFAVYVAMQISTMMAYKPTIYL